MIMDIVLLFTMEGCDFETRRNSCITQFDLAKPLPLASQKAKTFFLATTCSLESSKSWAFSIVLHWPFPASLLLRFSNTRVLKSWKKNLCQFKYLLPPEKKTNEIKLNQNTILIQLVCSFIGAWKNWIFFLRQDTLFTDKRTIKKKKQ